MAKVSVESQQVYFASKYMPSTTFFLPFIIVQRCIILDLDEVTGKCSTLGFPGWIGSVNCKNITEIMALKHTRASNTPVNMEHL